ncbi:unnamed protein product [Heterobilharzia americana]|nr:unnamed protein product [Heterobilharzia americana]CAH8649724.1 unnamed protein product [Heterobilharzia americana]
MNASYTKIQVKATLDKLILTELESINYITTETRFLPVSNLLKDHITKDKISCWFLLHDETANLHCTHLFAYHADNLFTNTQ